MKNNNSDYENNHYSFKESVKLEGLLELAKDQKDKIDKKRPIDKDLWKTIREKLKVDWTHNSNAIEGSTLTYGETLFFLKNGLTIEGKPLKDFLDARNHAEAIDFIYEIVSNNRQISEGLIKEINALLLSGLKSTPAIDQHGKHVDKPAYPGQYKKLPNHVLQPDGTIHRYVDPIQVPTEMHTLVKWIDENLDRINPIALGSVAHYNMVRIHPFDDGNGRGARILMNLIFIKKGYPPAVIRNENRRKYIETLSIADKGDLSPFIEFVTESLIKTQEIMLENLK